MSLADVSQERRCIPSASSKSPKSERKRTGSSSHFSSTPKTSETDSSSQKKPEIVHKNERRCSLSTSDKKHKKRKDVVHNQHHTYRMHRIKFFEYEPQSINCIACDEDNNRLALSRSDGSIEIWYVGSYSESADLCQQCVVRNESGTSIEALLWHNGVLFRAGLDGELVEYDMLTLRAKNSVPCHAGAIWCLALSPDNSYIAAGTEEGCVVIFEYSDEGFHYLKSLQKQEERMICIDWHISGEVIVTGGIDNIRLWSLESGNALQRITIARQSAQKPTIVWAVAILRDRTIVSGDSRGKLTFWNGKHGTQLKMFSCHRADILSIAVSTDETQVYAAGIDPVLVQFELSPVSTASDWMVWQRGVVRAHHTHDVRAMVMMGGLVISGGVDCSLVAADFNERLKYKTIPLPQHTLVHIAKEARLLLLQYTTFLQLWTLGVTNTQLTNKEESISELPLSASPVNLLELRTMNEEHIVCSAISLNAKWLTYCDRNGLRLFNLTMSQSEMLAQRISANRLRGLPSSLSHLPIRCIEFNGNTNLVLGYVNCSLKVLQLKETNSLPQISNIINSPAPSKGTEHGILRLIQISPDGTKIATSDNRSNLIVYELCHNELMVVEYSLIKRNYKCSSISTSTHMGRSSYHILDTVAKVINMAYANHDSSLILVQDPLGVRVFDTKTYLMHFEELDKDFSVVVERSVLALNTALPQALDKKQFGT